MMQLHYTIAIPEPETHLLVVTLRITGWAADAGPLNLKMPVWTPGSYLVREYARHLQDFSAWGGPDAAQAFTWCKCGKNHWQVDSQGASVITVRYRIFANELTVRTNHVDDTHAYFNGAAVFFYIPGYEHQSSTLTILPPHDGWKVATSLPRLQGNTFQVKDFDTLVDSPVEVGIHQTYTFEACRKPHQLMVWGTGNFDASQAIADIQTLIETEAELFGGLPYETYLFLLHLTQNSYGGLEHKDSTSLIYPRFGFRDREKYCQFLELVAHEFFHLWNIKRIRPKALEVFDYEQENYTPSLWFSEGTTSYYDKLFVLRSGLCSAQFYLKELSKDITKFLTTPGRQVQPLSESSFDAWVKLYRPDANSSNSQMSYYLKGAMVTLLLDLLIRSRHHNARSFDDVLRQMWEKFGRSEIGFLPDELEAAIAKVAECDLRDFFHRYLHTTEELPFELYLEPFGLRLQIECSDVPTLGCVVKANHGQQQIRSVATGSPAQKAGLDAGDELVAIAGVRVTAAQLDDRLRDYQPGDAVEVTVFRQDLLKTYTVILGDPQPTNYQIVPVADPSMAQQQLLKGWLGAELRDLAIV